MSDDPGLVARIWQWLRRAPGTGEDQTPTPAATTAATQARPSPQRVPRREIVALHLGIDFGTRFTKVCFRDLGSDRSAVVTFATTTPRLEQALLRSHIEFYDGQAVAGFTDAEWESREQRSGVIDFDFPKIRLAHLDVPPAPGTWAPPVVAGLESAEKLEAVCAFFLARVIDRACQWVTSTHADLLVGRTAQWSFSVGVPAKYANSLALPRFERVLGVAAAWARRGVPKARTTEEMCAALHELDRTRWVTEISVQAENAAAVRSFITSPQALEGVYLYFDVGAGTLDGASFRFYRPREERPKITLYSSEVEPLGIAAVAGLIASKIGLSPSEAERFLARPKGPHEMDGALGTSRDAIQTLIVRVIRSGRTVDRLGWASGLEDLARAFHRRRRGTSTTATAIPLFLGGGGSGSPFYRQAIRSTYEHRRLSDMGIKRYQLEELPVPDDLDMSGLSPEHFRRFAVAYGLSIPPEEGPEVCLEPPAALPTSPHSPLPLGVTDYANTKDLT